MSKLYALLAILMFSLSLLAALRSRLLARFTGSYARQYRFHHILGALASLAVGAHVASELAIAWQAGANYLFDTSDLGILCAWLSLLFLTLGVLKSYFPPKQFKVWRRWHLLLIFSFLLAAYHAVLFVQPAGLHQSVVYGACALGVISLVIIGLNKFWAPGQQSFELHSFRQISPQTYELSLHSHSDRQNLKRYQAGQIVLIQFRSPGFTKQWHPLSLASCQQEPHLRLLVKGAGRDTMHLNTLPPNAKIRVWGPFKEFAPLPGSQPEVWLAGGIGISPFLGYLHCLSFQKRRSIHLIHFVSQEEGAWLAEEMRALGLDHGEVHAIQVLTPQGHEPDFAQLDAFIAELKNPRYLICGPPAFMKKGRLHLRRRGVSAKNIYTEEMMP